MFDTSPQSTETATRVGKSRWLRTALILFAGCLFILPSIGCPNPTPGKSRAEKTAYANEKVRLGDSRIATIDNPGTNQVDLAAFEGAFAYLVNILAEQIVNISILIQSGGVEKSSAITVVYYPQYSPGFTFEDVGELSTNITNLDSELSNGLLIVLEGDGMATVTVSAVE